VALYDMRTVKKKNQVTGIEIQGHLKKRRKRIAVTTNI
jgi:hypothetical protein